mmetsp:Transcript_21524/g.27153  ORF Transcript_21524/g.27153 Transcript_21524/m.27153 type:complete len:247 (+) Transcript_21524:127-867(+)|eukprot:CAMPEP_0203643402 /NCGR_PEP_ID=MMETSP0088-20131115/8847_1 /ASSEMBLY_ACC=CAM_ASM_001087 /TAXON_ID=426623 /ORGANISM="Chaetoceros affinis, Strain CCMP159" /LENGTH=246 /DNA_ID=CAMNT_0050499567 /DNA_START=26 /DNA_END=766 /DNA_ORIENTATION=-
MKKDSPLIVAQECNDDDIDSLLDASLHEQNLSSHGSAKFLSVYDLNSKEKGISSAEAIPLNGSEIMPEDLSNGLESNTDETSKSQNSCSSVTGTEVKVVRRDSVMSAVTLGESSSKRIELQEIPPVPDSLSPQGAMIQDSDSSCSSSTTEYKKCLKRRSSFASEPKLRRRSISFNETVDKVTYDENSCISQTSELLDRLDVQERVPPAESRLSFNPSSLAVIEDESPTGFKKKGKMFRRFIRRKKK